MLPSPKDALPITSLVEIGPVALEKIFKFRQCFCFFVFIAPRKECGPLFEKKLNSPHPSDALCQVW